jgi:hypothetical protein
LNVHHARQDPNLPSKKSINSGFGHPGEWHFITDNENSCGILAAKLRVLEAFASQRFFGLW